MMYVRSGSACGDLPHQIPSCAKRTWKHWSDCQTSGFPVNSLAIESWNEIVSIFISTFNQAVLLGSILLDIAGCCWIYRIYSAWSTFGMASKRKHAHTQTHQPKNDRTPNRNSTHYGAWQRFSCSDNHLHMIKDNQIGDVHRFSMTTKC